MSTRVQITVTGDLLRALAEHRILLRYNQTVPVGDRYGWLDAGKVIALDRGLQIEENSGFYGGSYVGMKGSRRWSGLWSMGAFSYSYSPLPEPCIVGRYCSISDGVRVLDSQHPTTSLTSSALLVNRGNLLFDRARTEAVSNFSRRFRQNGGKAFPVIEHDVWIGAGAMLAMVFTVGTGAVIASNAVVSLDVPAYSIVAGNPARVKKYRFEEPVRERLLESRWWEFEPREVFASGIDDPIKWLDRFEVESATWSRYTPRFLDFARFADALRESPIAEVADPSNG